MRIIAIIQARMGSSRLPGKILANLAGEPALARCRSRVLQARMIDEAVIATSDEPGDDIVEDLCRSRNWPFFRGSENDVLDRFYQAARSYSPDAVVRITGDCPLVAPEIIDKVVGAFAAEQPQIDHATTGIARLTWARGMDTEVMRFSALETAWREDADPKTREHVTPYLYRHPDRFRCMEVPDSRDCSHIRLTVDTAEDLEVVRKVVEHFGHDRFTYDDILALLARHPEWLEINRNVRQVSLD